MRTTQARAFLLYVDLYEHHGDERYSFPRCLRSECAAPEWPHDRRAVPRTRRQPVRSVENHMAPVWHALAPNGAKTGETSRAGRKPSRRLDVFTALQAGMAI